MPLFLQIRTALERARLEQQSPYDELRRLADQLELPELADVADVMQLDETGAALSGTLRARVRELRDAHLTREQIKASAAAEGMTIYMTLPALIFGLIFLVAAMLKIFFPEAPDDRRDRAAPGPECSGLGVAGPAAGRPGRRPASRWPPSGGNPLPADRSPGSPSAGRCSPPTTARILLGLVTLVGWARLAGLHGLGAR